MALPSWLSGVVGSWSGPCRLDFGDGSAPRESQSSMVLSVDQSGSIMTITYLWDEGGPQQGIFIVANDNGKATAGFSDSFHSSTTVMPVTGTADDRMLSVTGAYSYPGVPDWGWRIELEPAGDVLEFRMLNLTPEGEHCGGMVCVYSRA